MLSPSLEEHRWGLLGLCNAKGGNPDEPVAPFPGAGANATAGNEAQRVGRRLAFPRMERRVSENKKGDRGRLGNGPPSPRHPGATFAETRESRNEIRSQTREAEVPCGERGFRVRGVELESFVKGRYYRPIPWTSGVLLVVSRQPPMCTL